MKIYRIEFANLISAIGLLSMLAFASSAYAADGDKRGAGINGPMIISDRMADRLDLDDAQRESIKSILEAAKPQFDALRESVEVQVEAVLTPEQLAELDAIKERGRQFAAERQRGKGKRGKGRAESADSEAASEE